MGVAMSSDGTRMASGGEDGLVKVWNAGTAKPVLTLQGHRSGVTGVAVSGDRARVLSSSYDGTVKVWDVSPARARAALTGHRRIVYGVAVSRDGRRVVSGGQDGTVKVWDARTAKVLLDLDRHAGPVRCVVLSGDGSRIVSGSEDGTVKVWDAQTGKVLLTFDRHREGVTGVAVSGDGRRVASSSQDGTAKVWDAQTGKVLFTLDRNDGPVLCVAISPDGSRIVTGNGAGRIKVWDGRTGKRLLRWKGHAWGGVASLALTGDGSRIVSGSADRTVKVWETTSGKALLGLRGHKFPVNSVAVWGDGSRIVSGSNDSTVKVWDTRTGRDLLTLEGHSGAVFAVAAWGDGRGIVSGNLNGSVRIWDASRAQDVLVLQGPTGPLRRAAVTSDGRRVLGEDDDQVLAWDSRTGQRLADPPARLPAGQASASADGRVQVSLARGLIRVQRADLEDARRAREEYEREQRDRLTRVEPDGDRRQLDAALQAGDDVAAAFHLDRLVQQEPWVAALHVHRAHVLARLGRHEESALHLARALMLQPRVSLWPIDPASPQRARQAAQAGDWPRAVREYQLASHQPGAGPRRVVNLLLVQLAAGDAAGAAQTVAAVVARLDSVKNAGAASSPLRFLQAAPWPQPQADVLLALARQEVARRRSAATLHFCGVALYRAGRYAEAWRALAEAGKAHGKAIAADTLLFRAMAAEQQGKHDEAAGLLATFERWHRGRTFPTWPQRVQWDVLLAEAQKLIGAR
jgi:WD40 repeat protein